jgi:hypothetical protein
MINLKNITKLAFVAAGIAAVLKIIEIISEMGYIYIPEGGVGMVIFKIFEAIFPISVALFFYVLHINQKK